MYSSALHCARPSSPAEVAQLALSPSNAQIAPGTAEQFSLRSFHPDGRIFDRTQEVTWSVHDSQGRALSMPVDGYLKVDNPGRYEITAEYAGRTLSTPLTVTMATVTGVVLNPSAPRVALGLSQAFTATATFSDGWIRDTCIFRGSLPLVAHPGFSLLGG